MRFVDVFAGLGGFHIALQRLNHECVFACEIDPTLRELYGKNFGLKAHGDIRSVHPSQIPAHDILCAGFPCQPFSKAGPQQGLGCPRNGDLFDFVMQILREFTPKYLILENVPNLARHDGGDTWEGMSNRLRRAGYTIREHRFSPHQFGIPQVRDRIYIVGRRAGLEGFEWPAVQPNSEMSIVDALEENPKDARPLSKQVIDCLNVWQQFVVKFPADEHLPTFPIWSMEFGATYPYESETPFAVGASRLGRYRGSHGLQLSKLKGDLRFGGLPSHARVEEEVFPDWKIAFIRQNRELYARNKSWIDAWLPEILRFPPSLQKLEWNHKGGVRDIWKYVIQFRASGVRVKKPSSSPSLIAMTTTQVPIIAWEKRYMTPRECASLQCLGELKHLPEASTKSFKALGNAVNATVVQLIAQSLFCTPDCSNKVTNASCQHGQQQSVRRVSRRSA
ncbi:MAG: DNA (cytosine-5-)-methyltransferase [Planctomycetota bacterium]